MPSTVLMVVMPSAPASSTARATAVFDADGVRDAGGGLPDPVRPIARAGVRLRALVHERAEPRHVDELRVLDALAERPRCGEHRVLEPEPARGFDGEIDPVLR